MDAPETLAKMFWENYKELLGNKAEAWNQITILQDFVIWLELRKTNGIVTDLRMVKNPTLQAWVDDITGAREYDQ